MVERVPLESNVLFDIGASSFTWFPVFFEKIAFYFGEYVVAVVADSEAGDPFRISMLSSFYCDCMTT